jgi:Ca-activated chloride channel family protein
MYSEKSRFPWGPIVVVGAVVVFACIIASTLLVRNFLQGGNDTSGDGPGSVIEDAPAGSVVIDIASSNTKENWIDAVVEAFNAEGRTISSGETIFVRATHVTSGGSQRHILDGIIQPQVWSPGDRSWVETANEVWRDRTGSPLVSSECPSTILAPSGFAMWRPMAEALGWPDKPISWDDLVDLSADPDGWASRDHPEWGQFKFGHAHPVYSNVGLQMMTALAYSTVGTISNLQPDQIFSESVLEAFTRVEQNTYHYGIQSRNLINLMVLRGPTYLHAVTTSEAETLKTNAERGSELRFPLAFIFPAEGTFWSEHPYCVLDTDWVSLEQKEGAEEFLDYLLNSDRQALAIDNYLRPVNQNIPLHAPLSLDDGTDPRITTDIVPALESPSSDSAGAVKDVFLQTKKKATVILALDTSGSMEGEKIKSAVESAVNFIRRLDPDDEVFVLGFGGFGDAGIYIIDPSGRAGEVGESLARTLNGLFADGNTPLYDAICEATALADGLKSEDILDGENRLYGIVLLSDGEDTSSDRRENQMFNCLPSGESVGGVKIFTIAYGEDADDDLLLRIANRTNGKFFTGDPEQIERIYNAISAEQ